MSWIYSYSKEDFSIYTKCAAEYELAYGVSYVVKRPGEKAIEKRFELYRNYQDDPDHALAKAKELELLISEIRKQASSRIVRELSQL